MCLSCVLSLTPSSDGKLSVSVGTDANQTSIELSQGDLLVMKSRHTDKYSITKAGKKTAAILYWVTGPKDIKNKLF